MNQNKASQKWRSSDSPKPGPVSNNGQLLQSDKGLLNTYTFNYDYYQYRHED